MGALLWGPLFIWIHMKIDNAEQGTQEWLQARLGRVTGTRIGALMGVSPWTGREEALDDMVRERLSGRSKTILTTPPMRYGVIHEPIAASTYEGMTGRKVIEVGLCYREDNQYLAASPDGFIGEDGGLEIKSPYKARNKAIEWQTCKEQPQYYAQVQWCLYVTGRSWWDFFQWSPVGPQYLERVERDEEYIAQMLRTALEALDTVDQRLAALSSWEHVETLVEYDTAMAEAAYHRAKAAEAMMVAEKAAADIAGWHDYYKPLPDGRRLSISTRYDIQDMHKLPDEVAKYALPYLTPKSKWIIK